MVGRERLVQAGSTPGDAEAVRHRHPPAQPDRRAAHGSRDVCRAGGPDDPPRAHAGHAPRCGFPAPTTPASPPSYRSSGCWSREGTSRREVGREEFLRRTWEWKEKYRTYITRQLRRLGASCDWDRERFTWTTGLSAAVREAFVRYYRLGLHLSGRVPRELVAWSANGCIRPGSGILR